MKDNKNLQSPNKHIPEVSIGMPVYNGEMLIRQALDSVLEQTFADFELIISDNGSTDGTEAICRKYADCDQRVRYVRQPENRGGSFNFQFVLNEAHGKYFMWAAHDDTWGTDFVSSCIKILNSNTNVFACITNILIDGEILPYSNSGITPLTGSELQRVRKFLRNPGANSRFYSLYRTKDLKQAYVSYDHLAGDWSNILDFIKYGEFITIEDYFGFNKTLQGIGSQASRFSKGRKSKMEFILPYLEFSKRAFMKYPCPLILFYLLRLNISANIERTMNVLNKSNGNSLKIETRINGANK
jgi:glycosyltransferase involved in cell wall biosynthesis